MGNTVEARVRRQIACQLEKSMNLKDPGGWPDHEEITSAINNMDNANLLRCISEAIEGREDSE
jgi:hypothetical protein